MGCGHHEPPSDDTKRRKVDTQAKDWTPISGNYQELTDRKLREETLKRWQYQVGHYKGKPTHIMNVRNEKGELVAQKYRLPGKEFRWEGDGDDLLYGMWLWGKGKSITITEGELDALSVSQAFDLKWPVVSLPNGAQSVKRTLKRCYDYLSGFDKIVLMFDMDEPGRKAVEEAALMLPAGKVFIATLPEKDANDVLKKQGPGAIVNAFWQAKPYRPDGIIRGSDLKLDDLMSATAKGFDLRCPDLNNKLLGLRKAEITLFTAGSGIGKSTLVRQLMYELHEDHPELKFGNIFLEENNKKTAQAYIALDNKVPLGKLRYNTSILTPEQWAASKAKTVDCMYFYDHFGSLESERLLGKMHYLATVEKVDFIALDHISIVTSGLESGSEGERKDIDILMTNLVKLVESTGVGVIGVVHLKRVTGKSFNEGAQVSLSDLRGSAALEQLSYNVIALERDQQGDHKDRSRIRVLKCRENGDLGESDVLQYNRETGWMEVVAEQFEATDETDKVPATF
jgi:twinkle protein